LNDKQIASQYTVAWSCSCPR